jgi:Ca2+-binding EF-hand superfamily protein
VAIVGATDGDDSALEDNPELSETHDDEPSFSEESTDHSEDNLPSDDDVSHDSDDSAADESSEHDHEEPDHSGDDPADDLDTDYSELSEDEIKQRFEALHKHMDANGDGKVSEEELKNWNLHKRQKQDNEDIHHTFKARDTDGNGQITWPEYVSHNYGYSEKELEDLEKSSDKDSSNEHFKKQLQQEKEAFDKADANQDKSLNVDEHLAFERPKHYLYLVDLLKEAFDKNNDSLVDATEFAATNADAKVAEEEFKKLDVNNDGKLGDEELLLWGLSTGLADYSAHEAKKWMSEADSNKDSVLEVNELLEHRETWAPSAHSHHENTLEAKEEL